MMSDTNKSVDAGKKQSSGREANSHDPKDFDWPLA